MHLRLVVVIVAILVASCQKDETLQIEDGYPEVDPALWPYFERFEAEGLQRGLLIDLNDAQIIGLIENIHESDVVGQCSYGYSDPGTITIDQNFWSSAGTLEREMIVFHELGHCYLDRIHLDDAFPSGYCVSIMSSGTGYCRMAYTMANRDYYLDELFLEDGPAMAGD